MVLADGDSVEVGRGVIEGMVVIEGDNDGGGSLGRTGSEGEAVKLGDAVNRTDGRGVGGGIQWMMVMTKEPWKEKKLKTAKC